MRYSIAAASLAVARAFGSTALAAHNGMGTGESGYGYHRESNGAATGWPTQNNGYGNAGSTARGNAENGNGYCRESNGSATVLTPRVGRVPFAGRRDPSRRKGLWSLMVEAWHRHRSRQLLAELDGHMLKDIGMTFAEAEREANKPFWVP